MPGKAGAECVTFVGSYGGSWWYQNTEFESFNGVILLAFNCQVLNTRGSRRNDRRAILTFTRGQLKTDTGIL